jgi:hypothetical protein
MINSVRYGAALGWAVRGRENRNMGHGWDTGGRGVGGGAGGTDKTPAEQDEVTVVSLQRSLTHTA